MTIRVLISVAFLGLAPLVFLTSSATAQETSTTTAPSPPSPPPAEPSK